MNRSAALISATTAAFACLAVSMSSAPASVPADPRYQWAGAPSDPRFAEQWSLANSGQSIEGVAGTPDADIDAPEAWDTTTGSDQLLVAVLDSGTSFSHPDLAANLAQNSGETGGGRESNGADDDRNGFVDDFRGWDFEAQDNDPTDEIGHGTHITGVLAARGDDGAGVTGVLQRARVLPVKVGGPDGPRASAAAAGIRYAAARGARIVNLSFSGPIASRAIREAIRSAPDTLFVAAAGNDGRNIDVAGEYPCAFEEPNIICVGASDQRDGLAGFSNHGAGAVDVAAPGRAILGPAESAGYRFLDGTSASAAIVSGIAGLALAQYPQGSVAYLRRTVLGSAELRPGLRSRVATGGRVNAALSLDVRPPEPFSLRLPTDRASTRRTKPNFSWRQARDEKTGVEGYELVIDGRVARRVSARATSTRPAQPLAEGRHTWLVRAFDGLRHRRDSRQPRTIVVDRTRPGGTLTVAGQSLSAVVSRGLAVRCAARERARCVIELRLGPRTARRLGLRVRGRRSVLIGRSAPALRPAVERAVRVRLSPAGRGALRRAQRRSVNVALIVRARIADAAGNADSAARTLILRRAQSS